MVYRKGRVREYKFTQLSKESQNVAIEEYMEESCIDCKETAKQTLVENNDEITYMKDGIVSTGFYTIK